MTISKTKRPVKRVTPQRKAKRIVKSAKLKETLKEQEKSIRNSRYEWQVVVSLKDGSVVDKWTSKNPVSVDNKYLDEPYYADRRSLINIHNHPRLFHGASRVGQAPSLEDIINLECDSFGGRRIIEEMYTHVLTPKPNKVYGQHSYQYYEDMYRAIWDYYTKTMRADVNSGKTTLTYYYNNLQYKVAQKMLSILGWNYIIRKNHKSNGNIFKYPEEIFPPWLLPKWLSVKRREYYLKKWEEDKKKYPELKKLKEGEQVVKAMTPVEFEGKKIKSPLGTRKSVKRSITHR